MQASSTIRRMSLVAQVTTYPFGVTDSKPLELLAEAGIEVRLSPHGRKHTSAETQALLGDVDILIAGTEPLTPAVLSAGLPRLKQVSKVGVGMDGVDVDFCRANNIAVTYTPDAPARSVVEQVFGVLISLSRQFISAHEGLRLGEWRRLTGVLWDGKTLGILGCGRIGKQVAEVAKAFRMHVLAHDIVEDHAWAERVGVRYVDLETLMRDSLAVTVHLPLDDSTRRIINAETLAMMRPDAWLVNTCRGPVVHEAALVDCLQRRAIAGAAIDVYEKEPYQGPLSELDNVFMTCHQGSCSVDGRRAMEVGAAENAIQFISGGEVDPDRTIWLPNDR